MEVDVPWQMRDVPGTGTGIYFELSHPSHHTHPASLVCVMVKLIGSDWCAAEERCIRDGIIYEEEAPSST